MLNYALSQFIKDYCNNSRSEAGKAIGCSGKVIGQMLRGEMAIPLWRAFLIEEASKGDILIEALIVDQNPPLAKAIKRSRERSIAKALKDIKCSLKG